MEGAPAILEQLAGERHFQNTRNEQGFIRSGLVKQVQISNLYLPWKRLFEVGFDVQVTLAS